MPGCVLRAYGRELDVDGFLATSAFQPCAVFHRGKPRTSGSSRVSDESGFNLVVSSAGGDCVPVQIRDAEDFVTTHRTELIRLASWPGVQTLTLDFGWDFPRERVAGQSNIFPPSLLKICGGIGIAILVSVYAVSDGSSSGN